MNGLTFKFDPDGEDYKVINIVAPSNGKYQYIIYTDGQEIFASRYIVNENKQVILSDIEEEYEWDYIDKILMEGKDGK